MMFARVLARSIRPAVAVGVIAAAASVLWYGATTLTGSGDPAPLFQPAESPAFVFVEFGRTTDAIRVAPVTDPSDARTVATVAHAEGFGIYASLSPDGQRVAYTVVPTAEGEPSIDSPAELRVIQADTGDQVLATGADLLVPPVWSPGSDAVVFRRSAPAEESPGTFELVRIDLSGNETTLVSSTAGLFPIGYAGGVLHYAVVSASGTDLYRYDGGPVFVAHLSDDIARDWRLSPDREKLAYLVMQQRGETFGFMARVYGLAGQGAGGFAALDARDASTPDEFGPIWNPATGGLTLGRLEPGGASLMVEIGADGGERTLTSAERGFDVPVSWSPDGAYLIFRWFLGDSAENPGPSRLHVLMPEGERQILSINSDIQVIGWVAAGGGDGSP
jgi:Tol biopolymer transport system component